MAKAKDYIAVIFAMIFWSFSFIWTRIAMQSFNPVTLISLRLVIAAALLFAFVTFTGKFQKIAKKDLKWFLLLAFFEPFLYYMGETYGLTMVEPTLASVIVATIPLFASLFAVVFLRERIGIINISGIVVSLLGVFLVVNDKTGGKVVGTGILLLFLAVFSAVIYSIILKKIPKHYTSLNIVMYQSMLALLFFIPTFFVTDFATISTIHITLRATGALLMLSVFASMLAFVFFSSVIRKLGVAKTTVFNNLIPVFTAFFSWLILDEILSTPKFSGVCIVILGLFISQLKLKSAKGHE
ncbi:MAG: DMT family transporter [Prevotellaceae bacterium]|nr:DMT family transporter [Prevotellaceae bacterium]